MDNLQKVIGGLNRFTAVQYFNSSHLEKIDAGRAMRIAAEENAHALIREIMDKYTHIEGLPGINIEKVVTTTAYILSESELRHLIAAARESGRQDMMKWG